MADYRLLEQVREHLAINLPSLQKEELTSHQQAKAELEAYIEHIEKIKQIKL